MDIRDHEGCLRLVTAEGVRARCSIMADPLGCHRPRVADRLVFEKLLQVLRFGCSYESIADGSCSAAAVRNRRDEWVTLGVFEQLKMIVLGAYDRIVGLLLDNILDRRVHHQGARWWRGCRPVPGRPGQARDEAV